MISTMSRKVAITLATKEIISNENIDVYAYGLELFFFKAFFYCLVLLFALTTETLMVSILFLAMFLGLRQYTGGYHCKTSFMCLATSLLIYFAFYIIYNVRSPLIEVALIITSMLSVGIIVILSPRENVNKPLTNYEKKKYRWYSIIITIILLTIATTSQHFNISQLFYPSAYSLSMDALLILVTIRRCKNEKHNSEGTRSSG